MFTYIIAIGWLYVVFLMSITESSLTAGIMTFLFYGVLPLSLFLYLLRAPSRKKLLRAKAAAELSAVTSITSAAPLVTDQNKMPESKQKNSE
ncbi:hypothetical protein BH11PSE12_BH11PSE12_19170 [soil metagenome]